MKTKTDLIKKYNRPGPRYTSYPPVPFWKNTPDETTWISHLKSRYDETKGIDLYVHVPFCESLCYYCGCSRTITKNHGVEDPYLNMVLKEWELYQKKLGLTPKVNSLHFGGGTPTFLSPENLNRLMKTLLANKTSDFIGSIEIDPRTCTREHLDVLVENGIKRVSLGIQDFDSEVQKIINRTQPVKLVESLVNLIRDKGIKSINFDLIYGLPGQTIETITETIRHVKDMNPDLIAFYSYAHLPGKIKNQKLIPEDKLPSPELKRALYEEGKKLLHEAGYTDIGMDHFAKPHSYLYEAREENKLHRNFMGYVDKKSPILLGLGPTSISDSGPSFMQNAKDLKEYETLLSQDKLPIEKGHTHTKEDLLAGEIIMELMCKEKISIQGHILPYWEEIIEELSAFVDDGIIELQNDEIRVTDSGKPFVRNVAMTFDTYLRNESQKVRFSQTI